MGIAVLGIIYGTHIRREGWSCSDTTCMTPDAVDVYGPIAIACETSWMTAIAWTVVWNVVGIVVDRRSLHLTS